MSLPRRPSGAARTGNASRDRQGGHPMHARWYPKTNTAHRAPPRDHRRHRNDPVMNGGTMKVMLAVVAVLGAGAFVDPGTGVGATPPATQCAPAADYPA